MELRDFFKTHPRCALGFSGGTDSAYLLAEALRLGAEVKPFFVRTAFQPELEAADAARLCAALGVELTVIEYGILSHENVRENGPERCYHCKKALFSLICDRAAAEGLGTVIDGTNASDDVGGRPGWRAMGELGVLSPLRMCGIGKDEVRRRSRELGLFTADKCAYACLATRVPTGMEIRPEDLRRIERAEEALAAMGFYDFRCRLTPEGFARIELRDGQLERGFELRREICAALGADFLRVTLDLKGR